MALVAGPREDIDSMPKRFLVFLTLMASVLLSAHTGPLIRAQSPGEQVDLLLVLASDVSQSVNAREFRLQREGYAAAMLHPRVLRAITGGGRYGRIAVSYVEWSGPTSQRVIVNWMIIAGRSDALHFATKLREKPRPFSNSTSISAAVDFIMNWVLPDSPFSANRTVIDITGDGTNTSGRPIAEARDAAVRDGAVINGLVILDPAPPSRVSTHTNPTGGLKKYFETNVVGGNGSFVMTADGFDAFGRSIVAKLIKEIALGPKGVPNRYPRKG